MSSKLEVLRNKCQTITKDYSEKDSIDRIASEIVDYVISEEMDIKKFDFQKFFIVMEME